MALFIFIIKMSNFLPVLTWRSGAWPRRQKFFTFVWISWYFRPIFYIVQTSRSLNKIHDFFIIFQAKDCLELCLWLLFHVPYSWWLNNAGTAIFGYVVSGDSAYALRWLGRSTQLRGNELPTAVFCTFGKCFCTDFLSLEYFSWVKKWMWLIDGGL